ncbi:MAG: PAS domain-containing protein, partial [Beijerinckiaceae bacterium]
MMPNFLPSSLRENPFRGELTDEQFQTIFAQNICYSVLDENAIIAITDVKGVIKYANHAFVQLSQYSPAELVGADHRILNSGFHPRSFFTDMYRDIAKGKKWRGEIRNRAKDGSF